MGSFQPSIRISRGRGALSSVPHSNDGNGMFAVAPPLREGYAGHLQEELAVFETEDFDAQTLVQSSVSLWEK
jgi:hypothetical protein